MEEWRTVEGWPVYEVSSHGNVRRDGRYLKHRTRGRIGENYPCIALHFNNIRKEAAVHILVASHFIGPKPDGLQVNHKDKDRFNARADNLEYVTPSQNVQHTYDTGRIPLKGSRNPAAFLTPAQVLDIRSKYIKGNSFYGQLGLSKAYGVKQSTIWMIVHNLSWKEVI